MCMSGRVAIAAKAINISAALHSSQRARLKQSHTMTRALANPAI